MSNIIVDNTSSNSNPMNNDLTNQDYSDDYIDCIESSIASNRFNVPMGTCTRSKKKKNDQTYKTKSVRNTRVSESSFRILNLGEHDALFKNNYTLLQLRKMCKHYKVKITGTKGLLTNRLYESMKHNYNAFIIQRVWRKYLLQQNNELRGPALFNRAICVNETDFYSMDKLSSIPVSQIFSYKDADNKVYGFDIDSLYKLLSKGNSKTGNPYNRMSFPSSLRRDINRLIKIGQFIGEPVTIHKDVVEDICPVKQLELQTLNIFQTIDALGNLTDYQWFWRLGRIQLIRYIRQLADIWTYRAQLHDHVKREICPPDGNPFRCVDISSLPSLPLNTLRSRSLTIIDNLVKRGINEGVRSLGANYVLCGLTLVSVEAATALPWLYDSVAPVE